MTRPPGDRPILSLRQLRHLVLAITRGFDERLEMAKGPLARRLGSHFVDSRSARRYYFGMKSNTKSSITLPPEELKLVVSLQAKLKARSKVEVVRRGLRLLQEATDRESLRGAYRRASLDTRESLALELRELDPLASEGLDEP
jgi:hypothetical protein